MQRKQNYLPDLPGLKTIMCVAPAVPYYPLHGEMYGDKATDASSSTLKGILKKTKNDKPYPTSVCVCPGGFAEAVYMGFGEKYEVRRILGLAQRRNSGTFQRCPTHFRVTKTFLQNEQNRYPRAQILPQVSFLLGRMGFLKIGIECGVDIIPIYSFGITHMYKASNWNQQKRAETAQKTGLPMPIWHGRWGTNVPYKEEVVRNQNVDM